MSSSVSESYPQTSSRMGSGMGPGYLDCGMWGSNESRYERSGEPDALNSDAWGGGQGRMWGSLDGSNRELIWGGEGRRNPALGVHGQELEGWKAPEGRRDWTENRRDVGEMRWGSREPGLGTDLGMDLGLGLGTARG